MGGGVGGAVNGSRWCHCGGKVKKDVRVCAGE